MSDEPLNVLPFASDYRASGLLLHVTSLPTPCGIGDLGPSAFSWIDRLQDAGVGGNRFRSGHQVMEIRPISRCRRLREMHCYRSCLRQHWQTVRSIWSFCFTSKPCD